MKRIHTTLTFALFVMFMAIGCADEHMLPGDDQQATIEQDDATPDVQSTEQGLTTIYTNRTTTGSGPILSYVGQEVTQELILPYCEDRPDLAPKCFNVCDSTFGCSKAQYRYSFDPTSNSAGYNINFKYGMPSSGPGLGNPLVVKMCLELRSKVISLPTLSCGCTDVSSAFGVQGYSNYFNPTQMASAGCNQGYWGYSTGTSVKGYYPTILFKYSYTPSASKPYGTTFSPQGVIGQSTVTTFVKRETFQFK